MPRDKTTTADTSPRNSGLTDDERLALLHHHKRQYQALTLAVNEADAEKKRAKKLQAAALSRAVDECGPEADDEIMLLLQAEGPFGEANLRADVERRLRVLVWSGAQLQFAFEDLEALATPPNAYGAGKIAGIEGVTAKPPHEPGTEAFEKWMEGWHDGQGVLHAAFEKLEFYEEDMAGEPKSDAQIDLEDLIDAPGSDPEPIEQKRTPPLWYAMMRIISLGAGVQSSTMALMAAHGELGPTPAAAIFADTQAEPQSVYRYLDWLETQLPFPVYRVTHGNLAEDGLQVRVSGKSGRTYQKNLIPLFVKNPDGSNGILHRKCTAEYKVRVIIKRVRKLVGPPAIRAWRKAKAPPIVEQWIGISTDEVIRMKPSREPWIVNRWPLIESGVSRQGCLKWMEAKGYPKPPRSACVFCPYHSDTEWRRLRDDEPDEFQRAIEWERKAQNANERDQAAKGKTFLHASRVPLDQVDFSTAEDRGQLNMFGNECEGMCGV